MDCIACGKEGIYEFRALEVETLPVRDLKGEKKVQALREFVQFSICADCARQYLDTALHPGKVRARRMLLFLCFFVAGAFLTVFFWRSNGALRLLGLAACFLGVVGIISTEKTLEAKQAVYQTMDEPHALARAAWERITELAPRRRGDSNLSYIPVTEETLARKNGDLMILYNLLPAIAVEAHKRLHAEDAPVE